MDNANKRFFDYSYQGGVPILQLKPEVTKESLRLYGTPPGIHDMIDFFGRFEDELQKSHHPLKLATYIGENYRASLERLIKENKRGYALEMYTKVGSSGFILQGGKQVLSNKEVAELMRRSVMPKSSMQMMAILNTSVYPHSHWKFFESEENIRKNMRTYYQLWLTYLRNWDILLDLLSPASKYLPRYVMSQKRVKGLVEYLMEGAPNKEYAKHIFQRGVSEADRTDNLTWKRYNELYLVALDEAVKATEKVKDYNRMYALKDEVTKPKPPMAIQRSQKKAIRERESFHHASSNNAMGRHVIPDELEEDFVGAHNHMQESDLVPTDAEECYATADQSNAPIYDVLEDLRQKEELLKSDMADQLATLELPDIEQVEHIEAVDLMDVNMGEWLCAIPTKDGKNLVCWKFAETGKCRFSEAGKHCKFSHDPVDVERWKAAKKLGPVGMQQMTRDMHVRFGPSKSGGASSSGPQTAVPMKTSFGPPRPSSFPPTTRTGRAKT